MEVNALSEIPYFDTAHLIYTHSLSH